MINNNKKFWWLKYVTGVIALAIFISAIIGGVYLQRKAVADNTEGRLKNTEDINKLDKTFIKFTVKFETKQKRMHEDIGLILSEVRK